jgi:ketosteroid isomerase-like protein
MDSAVEYRTTFVVLTRHPDGRWLVRQETAFLQPGN